MYRRYYRRRPRRRGINKYNFENNSLQFNIESALPGVKTGRCLLIAPNNSAGVRKVVNLRGSIAPQVSGIYQWAVIYLPEGFDFTTQQLVVPAPAPLPNTSEITSTTTIIGSTGNTYMPSQNCLAFGTISTNNSINFRVPLSKNLNGGDAIILLIKPLSFFGSTKEAAVTGYVTFQYAICYR